MVLVSIHSTLTALLLTSILCTGDLYVNVCAAVKEAVPGLHIHAFSPEEIWYGAKRRGSSIREHLKALQEVGLGSLPGTSAEILDQKLRNYISPGRIPVSKWLEVIRTAHLLGIPTTSTVMYGHAETLEQLASHLLLLRDVQKETKGFTEFVPLSFVHEHAPMFRSRFAGLQAGPSWEQRVREKTGPYRDFKFFRREEKPRRSETTFRPFC